MFAEGDKRRLVPRNSNFPRLYFWKRAESRNTRLRSEQSGQSDVRTIATQFSILAILPFFKSVRGLKPIRKLKAFTPREYPGRYQHQRLSRNRRNR